MKTVVGMFDDLPEARKVVDELIAAGIPRDDINLITKNRDTGATGGTESHETHASEGAGIGAVAGAIAGGAAGILAGLGILAIPGLGLLALGPIAAALTGAGVGAAAGGIIGGLVGLGIPEEHAEEYEEGVKRGGTLVTARVDDDRAPAASAIFQRHHAIDLHERTEQWRAAGWKPRHASTASTASTSTAAGSTANAATSTAPRPNPVPPARRADDTQRIPVVDEKLSVGKRAAETGGVRVYTRTAQQPVAEQVQLRKESVHVERRPADRPATPADLEAFKEGAIEMRETSEEAVVQKQARVTGEVVVRKDVENRTETVRDTVRHTDVQVEKIPPRGNAPASPANTPARQTDQGAGPACNT